MTNPDDPDCPVIAAPGVHWVPSPFDLDRLYLSRWALLRLFCGATLRVSALVIRAGAAPRRLHI